MTAHPSDIIWLLFWNSFVRSERLFNLWKLQWYQEIALGITGQSYLAGKRSSSSTHSCHELTREYTIAGFQSRRGLGYSLSTGTRCSGGSGDGNDTERKTRSVILPQKPLTHLQNHLSYGQCQSVVSKFLSESVNACPRLSFCLFVKPYVCHRLSKLSETAGQSYSYSNWFSPG